MTAASSGKTIGALVGLLATLPVDLAVTVIAAVRRVSPPVVDQTSRRRTVLITGGKMTKALSLARAFHLAGHRVILAESTKYRFTGHRFSKAVDRFVCLPEPTSPHYADALLDVVKREEVDVFVPVSSPASSVYEADAGEMLGDFCDVVHGNLRTVRMVDDKDQFSEFARSVGVRVPDSRRITDPVQISEFDFPPGREYILKRIAYNPVGRMDLTKLSRATPERNLQFAANLPISEEDPWILQEYVAGQEYCTHGTARAGDLQVYACCESSAFQVNYEMVDKPEILSWVQTFVGRLGVSGQYSFDFIEGADGHAYAIECNPRTHSAITMFEGHPHLASAYLEDRHPMIVPEADSLPTYWIYHELWRLLTEPGRRDRMRVIRRGRDAIFAAWDPLPYLLVHHLQIPSLLVRSLIAGKTWTRIDFNIGKLVESGGD
ncbi:ATP-grasp enzyme [Gordonia rubripertincta]|uniref:ATP-grasp enzyme n=1 Tax=Gordonia rubripertincta TaxID=36822 RepID=A0ABT4N1G9_GORRU|nr:ATP-grasp enzyme [Gordonia rubripertincta]MCZ4553082.1 ATP-grasp enzyme [Gordonia rubripertincta]